MAEARTFSILTTQNVRLDGTRQIVDLLRRLEFRSHISIDIQFLEIAIDAEQIIGILRFARAQFLIDTFGGLFVFEKLSIVLQLLVDGCCNLDKRLDKRPMFIQIYLYSNTAEA